MYLPNENNLDYNWGKCTGYLAVYHNYRLKTSYYKAQFLNLYRPMVFNCEV